MTTLSRTKKQLLDDLKDVETRQIFQAEHITTAIPIQIRELRKKRKLTQKTLAKLVETDQSNISNWENPNYEYTPQIGTLERLADAFDVPLIVRFGSWEELWDWENNLTPERLAPPSFTDALPRLEASLLQPETSQSETAETPRRRRPFGLIAGGSQSTPTRPLDVYLGRQSQNQHMGRDEDTETENAETPNDLLRLAAGGRR